jgi:hypothetical protein
VAAACNDRTIRLWNVASGVLTVELKGQKDDIIMSLSFSPDGKTLAAGSRIKEKPSIRLWDLAAGKELRAFQNLEEAEEVVFSPDGKLLASSGGHSGKPKLWDVATGEELRALHAPVEGAYGLAFSPDGRFLAAAGSERDPVVRIWEVSTGQQVRQFSGHLFGVDSVAFAPDGRSLASGGLDSTVLIWDLTGSRNKGRPLSAQDLRARRNDLASSDGPRAFQAIWDLTLAPKQAVALLCENLQPAATGDGQIIARLIRDLDNESFAIRKRATEELQKIVDAAEPALRKELAIKPSLEVRRRIEQILATLDPAASPERLRALRAIQVLEYIGSPAARQLLQTLAQGASEAKQTREARTALERLAGKTPD